jgi:hypothetical protein
MRFYLHAGLPRTATTALQSHVLPRSQAFHFIGKNPDNQAVKSKFNPRVAMREACTAIRRGDESAWPATRALLPTVLHGGKIAMRDHRMEEADEFIRLWIEVIEIAASILDDKPLVYSDEALCESISGLMATPAEGDGVPLERLQAAGFLQEASVSIVLREPRAFLKASYYKTMEFLWRYGRPGMSYGEYIRRQLEIFRRHPPASRIFLGLANRATAHFRGMAARAVVIPYDDLLRSEHVLDTLLGTPSGDPPMRLAELPRENSTWRNPQVNDFILESVRAPFGTPIEAYAATFDDTLRREGVLQLITEDARAPLEARAPSL